MEGMVAPLLRILSGTLLFGALACSSRGPQRPAAPVVVNVTEDCTTAHIALRTEPGGELRLAKHTARADVAGNATLHVPRGALLFNGSPYRLALKFGPALEWRFTGRLELAPKIAVSEVGPATRPALLTGTTRSSCGHSGAVGDTNSFRFRAEGVKLDFFAWAVESARSEQGTVTLAPPKGRLRQVSFVPDFEHALLASAPSSPMTATARLSDASGGWIDVSLTLDPRQRQHNDLARVLGAALSKYQAIETTPVPSAPPFSPTAAIHPTLLFEMGPPTDATIHLRAIARGAPGAAVEAVAFYSTRVAGEERCVPSNPTHVNPGERFVKLGRYEGKLVIYEAQSGKLLVERTFREPAHCAKRGDAHPIYRAGNPEKAALAWFVTWAGTELEMFGESRGL